MRMFYRKLERSCSKRSDERNDEDGVGALKGN